MIERTPQFLMANLGSEVARLYSAQDAHAAERAATSSVRALNIVDELLKHPELEGRASEINILRTVIEDKTSPAPQYTVSSKDLEAYFMPFALRTLQTV